MTREELIAGLEKASQDTGFHYGRLAKAALELIQYLINQTWVLEERCRQLQQQQMTLLHIHSTADDRPK